MTDEERGAIFFQTSMALAALAVSVAHALQKSGGHEEPLVVLQREAQVVHNRLRQTPDAEGAVAMFRTVMEALRNPELIEQPMD